MVIANSALTLTSSTISFLSPAGTGTISVQVQTSNGLSNPCPFTYQVAPVSFTTTTVATMTTPSVLAWGPDGRLYVGNVNGVINIYTFDDNYVVTATQTVNTIAATGKTAILGLAFNPTDPPSPVKIYVSHSTLYQDGGGCPFTNGPTSLYLGTVSTLLGPGFGQATTLLSNLPASNHDHAVNGITFDDNGDINVNIGSNTNAGVADCAIGNVPESPLSAAIIKAPITKDWLQWCRHLPAYSGRAAGRRPDVGGYCGCGARRRRACLRAWAPQLAQRGVDHGVPSLCHGQRRKRRLWPSVHRAHHLCDLHGRAGQPPLCHPGEPWTKSCGEWLCLQE
jgi:hypothetical protein